MADFVAKKGDTGIALEFTLTDENGAAFDYTDRTNYFTMRDECTKDVKVSAGATTVVLATAGTGTYPWAAADVNTVGNYQGEIKSVLDSDPTDIIRFPRSLLGVARFLDIRIIENVE